MTGSSGRSLRRLSERDSLLESIATTTADYRAHDLARPGQGHVERWVEQFPREVQMPILRELDHVLKATYVSRNDMVEFVRTSITRSDMVGRDGEGFWRNASLLKIQQHGNSQADLLELLNIELRRKWQFGIAECTGSSGRFVYVDDILFSGRRAADDIAAWITSSAPAEATIYIVLLASHTYGKWRCDYALREAASAAGKRILIQFRELQLIENRLSRRAVPGVLWPVALPAEAHVEYVLARLNSSFQARAPGGPLGPFSSEHGRQLLERELTIAGARILAKHSANAIWRPLGLSAAGLGFGTMAVTYRNCPNNAPVALWWSLGGWYPLFPRSTYGRDAHDYDVS